MNENGSDAAGVIHNESGGNQQVSQRRGTRVMIETAAPGLPAAAQILRDYLHEMIDRYSGQPTDDDWISRRRDTGHGNDDLAAPTGILLLARWADTGAQSQPIGCVGLRKLDALRSELTRMFVRPEARRRGVAASLLAAAEQHAHEDGVSVIRLNTRTDLVAARTLYSTHGYQEIPRYCDDPLAEHCYEKIL